MKWLAGYVMRGRAQAVLVTVGFAVFSLILQPFSFLSGAALALVTLRLGPGPGLFVMAASSAVIAVLAAVAVGHPLFALAYLGGVWAPVYVLAWILRATINLPLTVLAGAALALLAVLVTHLVFDDPADFWLQVLDALLAQAQMPPELEEFKLTLARSMTALFAIMWYAGALTSLLLGRWWQALLYNPGGFKQEFLSLHIGKGPAWAVVALSIWSMTVQGKVGTLPTDLTVVALVPFSLAGIALVHALVEHKRASAWWLVGLYLLMLFMLPQVLFTLALVGLSDSWVDWRRRWRGPQPPAGGERAQGDEAREGELLPRNDDKDDPGARRVAPGLTQ